MAPRERKPGKHGVDGRARDPLRWAQVVAGHLAPTLGTARRILGSDDLAWDAVQETLVALWQEPQTPTNLQTWLVRAVTHRSLHMLRTARRRQKHEQQAAHSRPEEVRLDPVHALVNADLHQELTAALGELPEPQRQVFILHELEECDYRGISARLQIPVGTVRSRLNRARAALRAILLEKMGHH